MLVNTQNNTFVPVVTVNIDDKASVTGDGVVLNQEYHFIYELNGKKFTYSTTGIKMLTSFDYWVNEIAASEGAADLNAIRLTLTTYIGAYVAYKIDKKHFKEYAKSLKKHKQFDVVKTAKEQDKDVLELIEAYMYLKHIGYGEVGSTLRVEEYLCSEADIKAMLDDFENQPIYLSGAITNKRQMREALEAGSLRTKWI